MLGSCYSTDLVIPKGQAAVVVLDAKEAVSSAFLLELAVPTQVEVVARMDGVLVVAELQGE